MAQIHAVFHDPGRRSYRFCCKPTGPSCKSSSASWNGHLVMAVFVQWTFLLIYVCLGSCISYFRERPNGTAAGWIEGAVCLVAMGLCVWTAVCFITWLCCFVFVILQGSPVHLCLRDRPLKTTRFVVKFS